MNISILAYILACKPQQQKSGTQHNPKISVSGRESKQNRTQAWTAAADAALGRIINLDKTNAALGKRCAGAQPGTTG